MELWLATGNRGKLNEFKIMLAPHPELEIHSQGELKFFTTRPEDGKTFVENARIKARTLKSVKTGVWVIGEDSGIEVEGLGGLPGIHSARYAGPNAADSENNAKLLKMMQIRSATNRKAQFHCAMVVFTPAGEEWVFEALFKGEIAKAEKGQTGFGYDSIFIPEGETQTMAELGIAYKNRVSHRAQAIRMFLEKYEAIATDLAT
jgi:XTP/dITP diphosphohydrolase